MIDVGIVQGNTEQAKPLIIGKDTVYVHTDIVPVTTDADGHEVDNLFEYHEIQYSKDEYIQMLNDNVTDTQLALCELYESML